MEKDNIKTVTLAAKRYMVSYLLDHGIVPQDFNCEIQYAAHRAAYMFCAELRMWGEDDDPRLLADYPQTLWDHIKSKLGLKHKRFYVYQQETVIYPSIPPQRLESRVVVNTYVRRDPWTDPE